MTTQYTPVLKLALPVTGELSGTWGTTVNDNITSMIEQAVTGLATINTWTANVHTLTEANGVTSEARCATLVAANGAGLTAAGQIICPTAAKLYILRNTSSYAITLKTSAGTGIAVAAGYAALLFCDGTNVVSGVTTIVDGNITGNLIVGGTLGVTGATTLSSTLGVTGATTLSSTLAVTGNLTIDTDTLFVDAANNRVGIGTTSPAQKLDVLGAGIFGNSGSGSYGVLINNNDQSNVRLSLTNVGSGGQSFSLVGGTPGVSNAGLAIYDETNAAVRLGISSAGAVTIPGTLGVTGASTLTGGAVIGVTGGTSLLTGVATSNGFISHYLQNDSAGSSAINRFMLGNNTSTGAAQFVVYGSNHSTLPNVVDLNNANSASLRFLTNNTLAMTIANGGAVTIPGTLAVTGAVSGGAATFTTGTFSSTIAGSATVAGAYTVAIRNLSSHASAYSGFQSGNDGSANAAGFVTMSTGFTTSGIVVQDGLYIYGGRVGGVTLTAESASGTIRLAAGGSAASHLTVETNGNATVNTGNVVIGTAGKGINFTADESSIYSKKGDTGSIGSGVATTIFSIAGSGLAGTFIVSAVLNSTGAPVLYTANATVIFDGTDGRIIANNGASLTITLSGTNVQVTQASGGAATVHYRYLKISA